MPPSQVRVLIVLSVDMGLTPHALICHPRKRGFKSTARRWRARDKCFLTACGRVKSGLKPAVKNRAAHGSEDSAVRRVKTKADALVIGGGLRLTRSG